MWVVPLKNVPNQTFNIVLNGEDYRLMLKTIQGATFLSAWINGELLFYNQLCTPNNWVNPYNYVSVNGKLYFRCLDDNYPFYTNFNQTQNLIFYTPEEVAEMEAQ